ncbi:MAG: DUF4399 domain-containing protein [Chloroflexi bacterium]|nr:DUF4399 domain-containing protein [Chloroflexota bacterium]
MIRKNRKIVLIGALLLGVLALAILAGCKKNDAPGGAATNPAPGGIPYQAVPAAPSIKIVSPAAGSTPAAGDIMVNIEVDNFKIVPAGGAAAAGEGHVHFFLDVPIPTAPGKPAVAAPGTYQAIAGTSATWKSVMAGSHTFGVELVNNNHTPLEPPITASVTVTVK